jgi:hypothetical protein
VKILLSMIGAINSDVSRLYGFCEHNFSSELTSLVISQLERHVHVFRELQIRIESQQLVDESMKASVTPASVKFSISPARYEEAEVNNWPAVTSDSWVAAAGAQMKFLPPELPPSPHRSSSLQERMLNAAEKRRKLENSKKREIRQKTNKVRRAAERRMQQKEEAITTFNEKLDCAAQRREERIKNIQRRAHSEIEKVQENLFMLELDAEGR